MRPGRLSRNLYHLFISVLTLLTIVFAAFSKLFKLLLISIPNIVALFLNSKPRSSMFWGIGSTRPTGMRTVFSMLQHRPEMSPNCSSTDYTFFRVPSSSRSRQFASSAIAVIFVGVSFTSAGSLLTELLLSANGELMKPNICKSN